MSEEGRTEEPGYIARHLFLEKVKGVGEKTLREDASIHEAETRLSSADAVSRSAFKVMTGAMFALLAGLVSQVIVAAIFGAAADMDAYLTAFVVPNYLAYVLISGLSFVLVPAFIQEMEKGSQDDAWALVGTLFWITVIVLLLVAFAGSLLARQVIDSMAPGFGADKAQLAANMLSIMMFTVPCIALGSLMRGLQSARNRFFWPMAAEGVGSLGNVGTLLVLYPRVGPMALAWGNLVSAAVSAAICTLPILRHGWKRLLPVHDQRVRRILVLLSPFIVFGLVTRSALLLERYFASGLPDGDLSYLGYAGKISTIAVALLAASIASAIFPTMAREYAHRGNKGLAEQTEYGLRLTFATVLPTLAVCGAVALPLVVVLFERGAFSHAAAIQVSRIVLIVLVGDLFFRMLGNIISRSLYVLRDTLTYSLLGAVGVILYFPLARALSDEWGYVGLALAMPVQMGVANIAAFFILSHKTKPFPLKQLLKQISLYLFASLVAALGAWSAVRILDAYSAWFQLLAAFVAAGPIYIALLLWLDRKIALSILTMFGVRPVLEKLAPRLRPATRTEKSEAHPQPGE